MKKKIIILAIIISVSFSSLFSQGKEGPYVSLNLGMNSPKNSAAGYIWGAKLFFYTDKTYPIAPYFEYSYAERYEISSYEAGMYIHFGKKKSFKETSPVFLIAGLSYNDIKKRLDPADTLNFGINVGLGVQFYMFEIYSTYKYAGDYSSFNIKTQINIPWPRSG